MTVIAQDTGQSESLFVRHPAVSPDGETIAFSYAGDIWTVLASGGDAKRLTTHASYEHSPKWSPDGAWIAFSGSRDGDDDVFVIPANGGASKQLTFIEADDQVCGWDYDGSGVIFSSRRDDFYPKYSRFYKADTSGGTPYILMNAYGDEAIVSYDGNQVFFTKSGVRWWRKRYRGSGSAQVWQYNRQTSSYSTITDSLARTMPDDFRQPNCRWPMVTKDGTIYIVSDRNGTDNIYKNRNSGWQQLTFYKDDGVRFPSTSADGGLIAFECGESIYTMRDGSEPQLLIVSAAVDPFDLANESIQYSNNAKRVAFTPDEKQMLLEIRGEIFASRITGDDDKAARGRANNLTGNLPNRDGDFTLSPGGDSLIFVSDRSGSTELYLAYSDDPDAKELSRAFSIKTEQLTFSDQLLHSPTYSPDGKSVAYVRGKGDLIIRDVANGDERLLLEWWSLLQFEWSPDGKWIAYSREDDEYNSDIFIIPIEGGDPVNISRHPDEDVDPKWSADGSKLAFRSRRRENNWDIYFVFLKLADHQKTQADWAEEVRIADAPKPDDSGKESKKKMNKEEPDEDAVVIDTTDMHLRIRSLTSLSGEEGAYAISPDGKQFAFVADHDGEWDLYSIAWTGKDMKRLTESGTNPCQLSFSPDGKSVRYLSHRGSVHSVKADGGKNESYPFEATVVVNRSAERLQKFDEIWRNLNDQFYDPKFHGQDWEVLGDKYRTWVTDASCENDFGDVVRMMMGELNASHMGYYSPNQEETHQSGRLGLDFEIPDGSQGLEISHVINRGPCDRNGVFLQPGERILSINNIEITNTVNIYKLLTDQIGERTLLVVSDGKKVRREVIRPMSSWTIGRLIYDEWVNNKRSLVDSLAESDIGYLHIRGMGEGSLARFETELYSVANDKDGLIIDVRFNGGGWTTDYLLAMLQVKRHSVTFPRDGGPGYPQGRLPLYAWTKPIAVLCNEHSFSNAEIFSHAIKTLDRGKVYGVPTPGGVISTGGEQLIDGSSFRIPLRGWYVGDQPIADPERNMEGNGAIPDMIVPLSLGDMEQGRDLQLIKAVEEFSMELEQ